MLPSGPMPRPLWLVAIATLATAAACKDQETVAAQAKLKVSQEQITAGRAALATGQFDRAIVAFKAAVSAAPEDPTAHVLLADAYKQSGNEAAAVLALKQAEDLTSGNDPVLRRQRAELYRRMGQTALAIKTMVGLRDANQLTDEEVLVLARMQAHSGDVEDAWRTLERVQVRKPDDPAAKVVEAEILLINGDELLAAKLMDRLLTQHPDLTGARVLRARYFLNNGFSEMADQDLSAITGAPALDPGVITLKARVLNQLKRYEEALEVLKPLVDANPRDADLLAQLAETKLNVGQFTEAHALVDQALALRPKFARALYVRGRALEAQGELKLAADNYQHALKSDPSFGPALSRIWRIHQHRGDKTEAMSALERLLFMNDASIEEKATLAEMYAEGRTHLERGRKLIDEALRHDAENPRYKQIKAALGKAGAGTHKPGIVIIKGGR